MFGRWGERRARRVMVTAALAAAWIGLSGPDAAAMPPAPTPPGAAEARPTAEEVEPGMWRLRYEHPQLGPLTIVTRDTSMAGGNHDGSSVQAFDSNGTVVFEQFWQVMFASPSGTSRESEVASPVDANGHVFIDWFYGNGPAVSVLIPTASGFELAAGGQIGDGLPNGWLDASVSDDNGDGFYEVHEFWNDCNPSCAQGKATDVPYVWDGAAYVSTTPTASFPWYSVNEVPQMGTEPVRGTGCGADSSIGETIPDGWWFGYLVGANEHTAEFDLACVYYGASGEEQLARCVGPNPSEDSYINCNHGWTEFFPVNNSDRVRSVPIGPNVVDEMDVMCQSDLLLEDYYQWQTNLSYLTLISITNGQIDYVRNECPHD